MNRRLLLLFVSIVITFAVKAQATYSLSFNVGDYSLRTSGGLLSVFSSKTDERAVGGEHAPDLPYYPLRVLLPAGRSCSRKRPERMVSPLTPPAGREERMYCA